ncbi:MAG: hypothetical protein P1U80_02365 [Pseudomonadales bacterium]|nr:hypothetical protein [Pseudomonadales bacterium]
MSVIFSIQHISPGMSLADDVLDNGGRLLVAASTTLDDKKIRVLKSWGVSEVSIRKESTIPSTAAITANLQSENTLHNMNQFQCNDPGHKAVVEFKKLLMERECN